MSSPQQPVVAPTPISKFAWVGAAVVFAIFTLLLLGASVGREFFALPVAGWFSVGHLLALLVHVLPPVVAIVFLLRTPKDERS